MNLRLLLSLLLAGFALALGACDPECDGTVTGIAVGAPSDPKWTEPGEPEQASVCIRGTLGSGLSFELPDGRGIELVYGCGESEPCPSGVHRCAEWAGVDGEVYARLYMKAEDERRFGYIENHYQAGTYGSKSPYEKTSCTLELGSDGKRISGSFDGVLGAMRLDGETIDQERVRFSFEGRQ